MFKAQIYFEATEDSYEEGGIGEVVNSWDETLTADSKSELRDKVLEATYSKWEDLNDEQMNSYDWCTEYQTDYLSDESNEGRATESQIEEWKKGKLRLFVVHCHILVTEVTETKASL